MRATLPGRVSCGRRSIEVTNIEEHCAGRVGELRDCEMAIDEFRSVASAAAEPHLFQISEASRPLWM